MKKKFFVLLIVAVFAAVGLTGCACDSDTGDQNGPAAQATPTPAPTGPVVIGPGGELPPPGVSAVADALAALDALLEDFPQYINTGLPHVPGTTLYMGIAATGPWAGIIGGAIFHNSATDASLAGPLGTASSVFSMDENQRWGQEGIATWTYDLDEMSITITQVMDVYWHDGVPLTLDDLVFAFETMAHPDYRGPRFTAANQSIVGIMDFRNELADSIEGLVLSDDNRTLKIYFESMAPGMFFFGIWSAPTPRHVFEGIPVGEMAASEWARTTPIGWGPFMIEHIVAGEAISMVRNPNFVFGEPILERIEMRRIDPTLIAESMHNGTFDILSFPTAEYGDHMDPTNFRYLGTPVGDYSFIAFRLGQFLPEDPDNPWGAGVNRFAPDRLMAQLGPDFRRAMAYAIDPGFIGETVLNGLQFEAITNVPPNHRNLMDLTIPGFQYNPERANELLDAAGFTQRDAEGYRMTPDGEPLTVIWAMPEAPLTEHITVPFYIGSWRAVGIRVELWRGATQHPYTIWDETDFDLDYEPGVGDTIHLFSGAWQVGADPNPSGSWGHMWWNFSRYTSPEHQAILDRMGTMEAFDEDYWQQLFSEWQWYWYEQVYFIPMLWQINLTAINNRVTFWDTRSVNTGTNPRGNWHQVGLSAAQPYGR